MRMSLAAHRFTVAEYHRMGEAGVFHEDDRVNLRLSAAEILGRRI